MSPNDSSTGGFLAAQGNGPAYDADLRKLIRGTIVGVTGLADNRVIAASAFDPAKPPLGIKTDFCLYEITQYAASADGRCDVAHDGMSATISREESFAVMVRFVGESCASVAAGFRDGARIVSQNREAWGDAGISFIGTSALTVGYQQVGESYRPECTMTLEFSRAIERTYAILSINSAGVGLRLNRAETTLEETLEV